MSIYLHIFPLVAGISLVYAATRHEDWGQIRRHALRLCGFILGLLAVAMVLLLVVNTQI